MDATICDHVTVIVASDLGEGRVAIDIDSECPNVAHLAGLLKEADMDDLTEWQGNRILELSAQAGLTTTCLVPAAVFNCAWVELGMISRNLARDKTPICIHFVE